MTILGGDGASLEVAGPTTSGHWVTDKVSRIVELIREYDPNIDVEWIPPEKRAPNDPAFRLVENNPNTGRHIMFHVQNELEFDESVLARVFAADQMKNPLSLEAIDAKNQAAKILAMRQETEEMQEAHDLAASIWRSPKARYRHNGVTYE